MLKATVPVLKGDIVILDDTFLNNTGFTNLINKPMRYEHSALNACKFVCVESGQDYLFEGSNPIFFKAIIPSACLYNLLETVDLIEVPELVNETVSESDEQAPLLERVRLFLAGIESNNEGFKPTKALVILSDDALYRRECMAFSLYKHEAVFLCQDFSMQSMGYISGEIINDTARN